MSKQNKTLTYSGKTILLASAITVVLGLSAAQAEDQELAFNIPAMPLSEALASFSKKTSIVVLAEDAVLNQKLTKQLEGNYSPQMALNLLLKGSGLGYEFKSENMVIVQASDSGLSEQSDLSKRRSLDKQSDRVLEDIIVTATKSNQRLKDVPMSIAALTDEELKKRGINNFADLALAVPSLSIQDSGAFQRRITIRGIGNVFGSSSLVGVYVDEIPVTGQPSTHLDVRMHDLERVEVLRGPQGDLYGEASSGGTIRFITKKPELDASSGSAGFMTSAMRGGDASYEFKGMVNIPVITDELAIRVSGMLASEGGWLDQPARELENINDQEISNVRAKVLWAPTDDFTVETSATIHRNDAGAGPIGEDADGNYDTVFFPEKTPNFDDNYDLFNITLNYDFGNVQLLGSSNYVSTERTSAYLNARFPIEPAPAPKLGYFVLPGGVTDGSTFSQELRFSSGDQQSLFWTAGAFYQDSKINTISGEGFYIGPENLPPAGPFGAGDVTISTSKSWAAFGRASYYFFDKLEAGIGIRYFDDERTQDTAPVSAFQKANYDAISSRVFARYDISDDINMYASIAEGFRSGGFNIAGNPSYEPEDVLSYELGTKMTLLDGQIETDIALFYSDYTNVQVIALLPVGAGGTIANVTSNLGEATIKGIEALFTWHVTEQLSMGLSGNAVETEVTTAAPGGSHAVGDDLDLVPDYSGGVWLDYNFNWSANLPGFVRLDFNKQGSASYRNRSVGAHYFAMSDTIDMLNARLGVSTDNWTVEVFANNLLNERGFIDPFWIELNGTRARPRTVGFRVGMDF